MSIILYHGTIYDFTTNDVRKGKPYKDFGQGFYTTQSQESAINMALRNHAIELRRLNRRGIMRDVASWLYKYDLDEKKLDSLNVKYFERADKDWVRFVVLNRTNEQRQHAYDIVIGPTANDATMRTSQLYIAGEFGEVGSDEAIEFFLSRIRVDLLPLQFYFGTQRATDLLVFVERRVI